jgi:hypothetical protein
MIKVCLQNAGKRQLQLSTTLFKKKRALLKETKLHFLELSSVISLMGICSRKTKALAYEQ